MPTTSRRKAPPAAPAAAQLAAVRRAAEAGNAAQARKRVGALRTSFPAFKPLLALAWEVEDRCGSPMLACARAWEWQNAVPGSRAAVEALCASAGEAGLVALGARVLRRLRALDGQPAAPREPFESPLGPLSFEQAEAMDLGRMHLADNDFAAAESVLRGVDHPSARNNLAVALFTAGDLVQAREVIATAWQADTDNLFALERVVRWHCWAEGMERCAGFTETLRRGVPRRAEDATAQIIALRFLGDEEAARQAWDAVEEAPWWAAAGNEQRRLFESLDGSHAGLPGDAASWFPNTWVQELAALASASKRGGEAAMRPVWDACDAHADYLARAAELGDTVARFLALAVLKQRALHGADAARDTACVTLRQLLKCPCGPDEERMDLVNWLAEQGLHDRAEPIEVWLTGSLREIRSYCQDITNEPRPSPFPPAGTALNDRMHKAIARGAMREALALARRLRQAYPDEPSALVNLAAVEEALGHPAEKIVEMYRQAHAMAPDYLFARCGLAGHLAAAGNVDEARALLDGLMERKQWHRSEYRSFLMAQRALALAGGEHEAARAAEAGLREIEKGFKRGS